jgi:hypothetical protein
LFELGEYASIKTKCFLIRAEVRRLFNLIASRFINPSSGRLGGNTKKKIDALLFPPLRVL